MRERAPEGGRVHTARVMTAEVRGLAQEGPPRAHHWVVVYSKQPGELCKRVVLDPEWREGGVGRSSRSVIQLDSASVSRHHCRLQHAQGHWWLTDEGSLNGTYVNDQSVRRHRLAHGDRVQIGEVIFQHLACDDLEAAYQQALREAMVTDGLTGAHNERSFREQSEALLERARREGLGAALLLWDVDHFKSVNDRHGHPAGDRVLRELVRVAQRVLPEEALLGRVGGEEFAVLVSAPLAAQASILAERLRAAIAAHPVEVPGRSLAVTVSLGVCAWSVLPEAAGPRLFRAADEALYAAKRAGRNRVVCAPAAAMQGGATRGRASLTRTSAKGTAYPNGEQGKVLGALGAVAERLQQPPGPRGLQLHAGHRRAAGAG